jgi:hypothetical protein
MWPNGTNFRCDSIDGLPTRGPKSKKVKLNLLNLWLDCQPIFVHRYRYPTHTKYHPGFWLLCNYYTTISHLAYFKIPTWWRHIPAWCHTPVAVVALKNRSFARANEYLILIPMGIAEAKANDFCFLCRCSLLRQRPMNTYFLSPSVRTVLKGMIFVLLQYWVSSPG